MSKPSESTAGGAKMSVTQTTVLVTSASLCVVVSVCYWFQPDWLAAVTLVPAWCWLLPAIVLFRLGATWKRWRVSFALLLMWLLFVVTFAGECRSLFRFGRSPTTIWQAAREQGRAIRVVSLNCRLGNAKAAAEVGRYEPDIVLLQESPSREEVEALAGEFFGAAGSVLWDFDTSILTRGRIDSRRSSDAFHFVHGLVTMPSGLEIDVVCLRLNPPVARLDFWSPGFWRDHRNNRVRHREEIRQVMESLESQAAGPRIVVGGDFNAPAGDGALEGLKPRLLDTFESAGRGWGNTGTNEFPLFRVDQVWASKGFQAELVTAQRTTHSDHRLVVCDLVISE